MFQSIANQLAVTGRTADFLVVEGLTVVLANIAPLKVLTVISTVICCWILFVGNRSEQAQYKKAKKYLIFQNEQGGCLESGSLFLSEFLLQLIKFLPLQEKKLPPSIDFYIKIVVVSLSRNCNLGIK